jgi:hypothetical protein
MARLRPPVFAVAGRPRDLPSRPASRGGPVSAARLEGVPALPCRRTRAAVIPPSTAPLAPWASAPGWGGLPPNAARAGGQAGRAAPRAR